jgi:hypothetical protein
MANQWLRLWHETPTDPKFRTIAKASKQPICAVISIYIFMLVDASQLQPRGIVRCKTEDIASAFDLEIEQVQVIKDAMQGRLLNGDYIIDWKKRQPNRERESFVLPLRPCAEVWRKIRAVIFERDDYTCQYCGERGKKLECDHVIPVSRGGSHTDDNLVTACFKCNRSKRDKLVHEWRAK